MIDKAINDLRRAIKLRNVWIYQAYHEITAKYKHTALGSLWIAGGMLTTSLCLALVFGVLMGQNLHEVLPYIMGGILAFTFVSYMITEGVDVFISSAGTIKNTAHPFMYYVFEGSTRSLFIFFHNLVVFYLCVIVLGAFKVPHWSVIFAIPIAYICVCLWTAVFAMMASRYRDMRFLTPYIAQLMFFITPIFWGSTGLNRRQELITYVNPIYGLVEIIRSPLLGHAAPQHAWLLAVGFMIAGFVVWLVAFSLHRRRIPFWV